MYGLLTVRNLYLGNKVLTKPADVLVQSYYLCSFCKFYHQEIFKCEFDFWYSFPFLKRGFFRIQFRISVFFKVFCRIFKVRYTLVFFSRLCLHFVSNFPYLFYYVLDSLIKWFKFVKFSLLLFYFVNIRRFSVSNCVI